MLLLMTILPFISPFLTPSVLIPSSILLAVFLVLCMWRKVRKSRSNPLGPLPSSLKTCLVLGSGGHTTELLRCVQSMGPVYSPRYYILADTDKMSERRVLETEQKKSGESGVSYFILRIPRSREVRQSYISSVFSTIKSILASVPIMLRLRPDVIICNGPGTCVPICFLGAVLDLLLIKSSLIVFIESIARVKVLSLTGEILYRTGIADRILVQWPQQMERYRGVELIGRL